MYSELALTTEVLLLLLIISIHIQSCKKNKQMNKRKVMFEFNSVMI